jgi:hypothetical protein
VEVLKMREEIKVQEIEEKNIILTRQIVKKHRE